MKTLLHPILFSIFAGFFIFLIPKRFRGITEGFSIVSAIYVFIYAIKIFLHAPLEGDLLYIDGLSKFIVLGISFFGSLVAVYSLGFMSSCKQYRSYYAYLIWTVGASILAAVSNNILILLVAWGFLGFTFYMLINVAGSRSLDISKKMFIIIGGSDSLMILGFAIVWGITGSLTLSNIKIAIDSASSYWAFLLIAIGAFAKAGAMPFHTWLPDTAKEAPIPVTAFLPASLDKLLGIYLLARLVLNVFILDNFSYAVLMVIGAGTIVAAVMMALVQHDFRRLLGYHAVSQVGYMVLGLGTGNPIGIAGGLFHMLNNAVYKCCLFLTGGNVRHKTGKTDLDSLGGLATVMPITFFSALIAALSISGVPPFNGFFSKWMIYQGLVEKGRSGGLLWIVCIVAAMFGSGLTLASFTKFIHAVFLGKKNIAIANTYKARRDEVSWLMWSPPLVLAAICIIFGIFAYLVPLKHLIVPALAEDVVFIGSWPSLRAALFLVIGLGVGILIYLSGNFIKGIRQTPSYIGGEKVEDKMGLSATGFYATIESVPVLKNLYGKAERKIFDIYECGKRIVFCFIRVFQYLHNGVLSTYLVWCLLGMIVLFFSMVR